MHLGVCSVPIIATHTFHTLPHPPHLRVQLVLHLRSHGRRALVQVVPVHAIEEGVCLQREGKGKGSLFWRSLRGVAGAWCSAERGGGRTFARCP